MSCSNPACGCGCDPCSTPAPVDAANETLSSALDNFILYFYGSVTKTVVDGAVVWTLPCDLATGISGYPRDPSLGTACYFKDLFIAFDARITAEGIATTAARAVADAAQVTADAATARLNTFGNIVTQNKEAVNLTGGTISGVAVKNLPAPTLTSDAATKAYVDAIASGISPQVAARVASTANINLSSGPASVDGVVLVVGDRILVKNQTFPTQNGIWLFAGTGVLMTRALDADTAAELTLNRYYFVSSGSVNAGTSWFISTAPTILGTDPVQFSQFSAASFYTAGAGLQLVGSQFSIDTAIVMQRAQNLADLANPGTARSNLGVAAIGADTNYNFRANNLSDVANPATARTNLGVSATGADANYNLRANNLGDVPNSSLGRFNLGVTATGADTTYAFRSNNLSDLGSVTTARANLGLLSMALQAASAVAITGGTILGLTELKTNYAIVVAPIAAYDSASGGLYTGFATGAGIIRAVADNSGAYAPISVECGNGIQQALFDLNGLQAQLGFTTPKAAKFTTIDWSSNANLRTTKTNGHFLINVKDWGAIGDGATNDTAAINLAIAAMTNFSTLYFPAGSFLVTPGGISEFNNLSYFAIIGDGHASRIVSTTTGAPGNFLVVHSNCHHVTVRDFDIVGAATSRGSGIGLRMYASDAFVSRLYIFGTSDFAMLITNDAGGYTSRVIVSDCVSDRTRGDGFHFGYVTDSGIYNCQAYYTYDDGLGIGDDGATGFPPTRIEVVGFISIQAGNKAAGGTHGSGIRIFDGAVDIHVVGGQIKESCEAGLQTTRATSTTAYNTRIHVEGLNVYGCLQTAGMYANISLAFCNQVSLKNCWSEAPVSQCCYAFLDCNNLSVVGCTGKDAVVRTFVTDDGTTTNVAATWSNWSFLANTSFGAPSNESYYFVPAATKSIANLLLSGNVCIGGTTANYIATNRLATAAKINNNTSMTGKAITNGGTGIAPTTANNN